jgi:hypothetical protein
MLFGLKVELVHRELTDTVNVYLFAGLQINAYLGFWSLFVFRLLFLRDFFLLAGFLLVFKFLGFLF